MAYSTKSTFVNEVKMMSPFARPAITVPQTEIDFLTVWRLEAQAQGGGGLGFPGGLCLLAALSSEGPPFCSHTPGVSPSPHKDTSRIGLGPCFKLISFKDLNSKNSYILRYWRLRLDCSIWIVWRYSSVYNRYARADT